MVVSFNVMVASVLLAAHLYLLVHWERVRRRKYFHVGLVGLLVVLAGNFFAAWPRGFSLFLAALLCNGGLALALVGAVGACYPGKLPFRETGEDRPTSPQGEVMLEDADTPDQ